MKILLKCNPPIWKDDWGGIFEYTHLRSPHFWTIYITSDGKYRSDITSVFFDFFRDHIPAHKWICRWYEMKHFSKGIFYYSNQWGQCAREIDTRSRKGELIIDDIKRNMIFRLFHKGIDKISFWSRHSKKRSAIESTRSHDNGITVFTPHELFAKIFRHTITLYRIGYVGRKVGFGFFSIKHIIRRNMNKWYTENSCCFRDILGS